MDRRTFLESSAVAAFALPSVQQPFDAGVGAVSELLTNTVATEFYDPGIDQIRFPLAMVPAIREPGETLTVEFEAGIDPPASVTLQPLEGSVTAGTTLERTGTDHRESEIWPNESVAVGEYTVPGLGGSLVAGAYTLVVETDAGTDRQHGAVHLTPSFPTEPEIMVLADPHAGDGEEGWPGFAKAVAEINLHDPDLVLTVGDYINGQPSVLIEHAEDDPMSNPDSPGRDDYDALYEATYEYYEDAHRLLNGLSVPAYVTVGNHDGYIQRTIDGLELYERYFGPRHYSLEIRPGLRLVSANTYDWAPTDRKGFDFLVSAWGGQVRDSQLEWLRNDLSSWREENPDGAIIAMGHHSPMAIEDHRGWLTQLTEGIPIAEQFGRGIDTLFLQQGQHWFGENRLAFRELLAEFDVTIYASGHTHRDRIVRYHEGNGVRTETPGGPTFEEGALQYVQAGDTVDENWTQEELREIVTDPSHGPLFVETTTAESSTGQYEGWRHLGSVNLDGYDPSTGGYPADEAFLDSVGGHSRDGFDASFADLGLYSHPRGWTSVTVEADGTDAVSVTVTNELATPVNGSVVVSIPTCDRPTASGGVIIWQRRGEDVDDIKLGLSVPPEASRTATISCDQGEDR